MKHIFIGLYWLCFGTIIGMEICAVIFSLEANRNQTFVVIKVIAISVIIILSFIDMLHVKTEKKHESQEADIHPDEQ